MPKTNADDKHSEENYAGDIFERYATLTAEERYLETRLAAHALNAHHVIGHKDLLIEHRRYGDTLAQDLRDVCLELAIVERLMITQFREGRAALSLK